MFLGKVIGHCDADGNPAARDHFLLVQKLDLYQNPSGPTTIIHNTLDAGDGDIVVVRSSSVGSGNSAGPMAEASITGILSRANETPGQRAPRI